MTCTYSSELQRKAIHFNDDLNQLSLKTQGIYSTQALKLYLQTPSPSLLDLEHLGAQPLNPATLLQVNQWHAYLAVEEVE